MRVFKTKCLETGRLSKVYQTINVVRGLWKLHQWPEKYVIVEYDLVEVGVHPSKKEVT